MELLDFDSCARMFILHAKSNLRFRREMMTELEFDIRLNGFLTLRLRDGFIDKLVSNMEFSCRLRYDWT